MNDLAQRLAAIEDASQFARSKGALDCEIADAKNALRRQAVLESIREDADAECDYRAAVRAIEDALTAAERGITASQLFECFEHGYNRRNKLQFSRALDFVLGHAAVAEIELDGVETYVRTDTEFFVDGIEPVVHGPRAYRTKGRDADER